MIKKGERCLFSWGKGGAALQPPFASSSLQALKLRITSPERVLASSGVSHKF